MVPILKTRTWLFEPEEWQDVMRAGTLQGTQAAEWRKWAEKLVETIRITGLLWRCTLWSKVEVTHWMIMKYNKTQVSMHSEQSRSSESDSQRSDPLSRLSVAAGRKRAACDFSDCSRASWLHMFLPCVCFAEKLVRWSHLVLRCLIVCSRNEAVFASRCIERRQGCVADCAAEGSSRTYCNRTHCVKQNCVVWLVSHRQDRWLAMWWGLQRPKKLRSSLKMDGKHDGLGVNAASVSHDGD